VIESQGRSHPVEIRHLDRPAGERIEISMTRAIETLHHAESGSILAFLPGQGEIKRVEQALEGRLGLLTDVQPLYGGLGSGEQDAAIRPAPKGRRKVVLATTVAESSITIDGVRIVIDSGLVRQPVYEPSTGITRLETMRASRRRPISARAAPGAPNQALPSGSGGRSRARLCLPLRHRRSWRAILPPWCSIALPGVSPTRATCALSMRRPGRRSTRPAALLTGLGAIDAKAR
jgi:hypothetical protein